ncbi:TIGR03086 family metal-binding protein [Nocardioides sp. OK12]|uniref:TIGR03086 family metal-binding protein n=1 Tax=Nocardioides sp. OK12 TaxID=2758661 RepID=UPI0021C4A0F3|nr:TIGR03086 family metal-binding protein [Nocardioides sp. OK12]
MTDVQWLFERASVQFQDVVASLQQADWTQPTNCQVSVRELVEHVVAGMEFAVRLLSGAEDARSGIDEFRLGPDPVGQLERSCHAQAEAFARADRARPLRHSSGDIDFETFVRFRLGDLTIHAWDLAVAADLDATLEPGLVGALWELVEPHLATMQAMGAYGAGASGRLAPDTDAQSRLLDAFGRTPS